MKVISVFKTHFDIGFTDLAENVMDTLCTQMVKEVLEVCRETADLPKTERYVWTMPSVPLKYLLECEKISSEDKEELISFIEQDQIVWHALPFTVHTEFCGIDELIYGLQVSKELCDRFGKRRISAKMTDVPGHTWILPTLLSAAGIKFLHLGCNPASMPPNVPTLFWWEGPDGSRVLTMYAKGGYGSGVIPPENWEHPVWLSMEMTNDNQGPHTAEILCNMRKELGEWDKEAEMICGTLDDFYEAILPYTKDLPVIKKDLADTWIHGVGTYPIEVPKIRKIRSKLSALENICGVLSADVDDCIKKALHNLLMFGEHTWGCDVKIYLPERSYDKKDFMHHLKDKSVLFAKASWDEQRGYAEKAEGAVECAMSALSGLSDNAAVFSANGFEREQWINLESDFSEYSLNGEVLKTVNSINGREICIPVSKGDRILSLEKTLDTCNFVSESVELYQNEDIIEVTTPYNRAVFSKKNGYLIGLYRNNSSYNYIGTPDCPYKYEIFSSEDIKAFQSDYLYNHFDWAVEDQGKKDYPVDLKHRMFIPEFYGLDIKQYDNSVCLTMKYLSDNESFESYGNAQKAKISYTFYGFKEIIDVKCELKNKQPTSLLEAGYFVLPLSNGKQRFSISKVGSIVHPSEDIESGCNTELYCLEGFVNAQQNENSITVFADDMPLLSIGEPGILKYRKEYEPPKDNILYFNLFNNQWGTNFPQWSSGSFTDGFRIILGDKAEQKELQKAQFFQKQPSLLKGISLPLEMPIPKLPNGIQLVRFDRQSSNEWHLVIREYAGNSSDLEIDFSSFSEVYESNLLKQKGRKLEKEYKQEISAFSVKSFICIK